MKPTDQIRTEMPRPHAPASASDDQRAAPHRVELACIAVLFLLGVGARVSYLGRTAVEHFDEGVYAASSNVEFWFGDDPKFTFPDRHLYAPPLLPWLIRGSINLFGSASFVPMLPNLLLGSLTVLLMWWIGRSWFGPLGGLVAAALAAFSDFHISYSRAALTDASLTFWLALATFAIWRALCRPRVVDMIIAILATAAAWYTKYSGWLPLAIAAAGGLACLVFGRASRQEWMTKAGALAIVSLGTGLLWWLYLETLPEPGYRAVAGNHAQYLVGVAGWWPSLVRQWELSRQYDGWLTVLGFALAGLAIPLARRGNLTRSTWNAPFPNGWKADESAVSKQLVSLADSTEACPGQARTDQLVEIALGLLPALAAMLLGTSAALAATGIVGLPALAWITRPRLRSDEQLRPRHLAVWLLAAWFFGLLISIPLYTPYPRLLLPWHAAGWLALGGVLSAGFAALRWRGKSSNSVSLVTSVCAGAVPGAAKSDARHPRDALLTHAVLLGIIACELVVGLARAPAVTRIGIRAWEDRTLLQDLADRILETTAALAERRNLPSRDGVNAVYYVYGEPALLYQLGSQGAIASPQADLGFADSTAFRLPLPVFLVTGPHATTDPKFARGMARWRDRFELVSEFQCYPSSLVWLDRGPASGSPPADLYQVYLLR